MFKDKQLPVQLVLSDHIIPALAKIAFHIPDEKDKRHGQAVAAASLPKLNGHK